MGTRLRIKRLLKSLFRRTIGRNRPFYLFCESYVELYRSEREADPSLNGEVDLVRHLLPGCEVVFDVGANTGEWSRMALEANPEVELHCFEPSSRNFQKLSQKDWPENVHLSQMALADAKGPVQLNLVDEDCGWHSILPTDRFKPAATSSGSEQVEATTLRDYCEQEGIDRIDLIKVDVEGAELQVFKGGQTLFDDQSVRCAQFEYNWCAVAARHFLKDYVEFFRSRGYRIYKIFPRGVRELPNYDARRDENFIYANYAAALPGVLSGLMLPDQRL